MHCAKVSRWFGCTLLLPALVACNSNAASDVASPEPRGTPPQSAAPAATLGPTAVATVSAAGTTSAATSTPVALERATLAITGMR